VSAAYGIIVRDLSRAFRQRGRLVAGLVRPFMWLLLVGSGYNAIARVEGVSSYHVFIYPGLIVMASFFGAMLTAISTVYDREFGMLRLMLASPAGVPAVLAGRMIAATAIGIVQGGIVLLCIPLVAPVTVAHMVAAIGALALGAAASSVLGLFVAARLESVENFAAVINIVLFPLLFLSGALYPTAGMPPVLRTIARLNPVSYAVDLMRASLGQPSEFGPAQCIVVLGTLTLLLFVGTILLFDPEQRFMARPRRAGG